MNNRIEHVNAGYDPITNWRSHDLEGARSEALSGGVDATRAALLGLTAGKEHSADIQNLAAEETAYRQALFEAQAAIKTYIAEIMATEQELSVAQIQGLQTAQMYADNPEMIDNSLITGADVMDGITIGGAALLFVGEAIWRKTEKMSPESKRIIFALLVLAFGGIACLSNIPSVINTAVAQGATPVFAQGIATETQNPPKTATSVPTEKPKASPTPSRTPTATATEAAATLTPRQQEFLDQGYDKLSSLEKGVIYGILDETSVKYMKDGGVEVGGEGYALSTAEVTYYNPETKQFEKGTVVMDWAVESGRGDYFNYAIDVSSVGSNPIIIPQRLVKNGREQYFKISPGKDPFVKIMIDYSIPGGEPVNKFLEKIFPEFKGKIQVVNIPGIGKVIAIKGILPQGFPGW